MEAFLRAIRAANRCRHEAKTRFLTRLLKYTETVKLRNRCSHLGTSKRVLFFYYDWLELADKATLILKRADEKVIRIKSPIRC